MHEIMEYCLFTENLMHRPAHCLITSMFQIRSADEPELQTPCSKPLMYPMPGKNHESSMRHAAAAAESPNRCALCACAVPDSADAADPGRTALVWWLDAHLAEPSYRHAALRGNVGVAVTWLS